MPGRILNAESASGARILMQARLAGQTDAIVQATTRAEVLLLARRDRPDVVLLPEWLGAQDGMAICASLRADPRTADLPVILRLDHNARPARLRALEAGADAVIDAQEDAPVLSARIRNLMRRSAGAAELAAARSAADGPGFHEPDSRFAPSGRIALIVPDIALGEVWRAALAGLMRDHIRVLPEAAALGALQQGRAYDAIVVAEDRAAPERALRLIAELRSRSHTMHAALLLIQDAPGWQNAITALDIGIDDLVDTGFEAGEVALRLRRELARKARADRARAALRDGLRLAVTDPLTGLFNRRYALSRLDRIAAESARRGRGFAVLALDVDRFKSINDSHGHAAGDAALIEISRRMSGGLRQGDLLARIGGEEFLAVIRDCDLTQAQQATDRIRRCIAGRKIALGGGRAAAMTASIGVAMGIPGRSDPAELLARADRALYAAKAGGRDRVTIGADPVPAGMPGNAAMRRPRGRSGGAVRSV